jgi:beta-lactamase regulating signal transducer with metallopeptidase domain
MRELFIKIMQMSLTAGYVILAVLFVRLLLKKAPKIFSYLLWAFVLFRLLCPVSLESPFSIVPTASDTAATSVFNTQLQDQRVLSDTKEGTEGYLAIPSNLIINANNKPSTAIAADAFKSGIESVSMIDLLTIIWLAGIMILFVRAFYHYIRLKNKLSESTIVKNNVYRTDRIRTPFVLGLIQPKIYIPSDISDREMAYILLHEQKHLKRFDHYVKLIAYVALILHWFNPLVWLAYAQMVKDMEMSCDESVMKQSKEDIRAEYSQSLLTLSAKQSGIFPSMAFGDSNVKSRIKNIMNYKKPGFWLITIAVIALIITGICLITSLPGRGPELASMSKKGAEYEVGFIDSHPMIANYSNQFGKKDKLPELSDFGYDIRSTDLSEVDLSSEFDKLILSTFDSKTVWPDKLPEDFEPIKVMELYKNPGLEVRSLHEQGVTGKGVGIAIIDQPLLVDHIEYSEQLKYYYANPTLDYQQASMHGPAVASIAVGKTVGVAPEADLYYIAQDFSNAQNDNTPVAESINQILDLNEQLADENKIRVISISWGWDHKGIP